jgi:hypothetical protein
MTMLYSFNNSRPAPLPFSIRRPDGFTRTNPSTFTEDEISAAGFTGPYVEPPYDPATQYLTWVDGAYVIEPLPPPPPTPDWLAFKTAMLSSPDVNAAMGAATPFAPLAVFSLPAALNAAVLGDTNDFAVTWTTLREAGLIPQPVLDAVATTAVACQLPDQLIQVLNGDEQQSN